MSVLIRGMEMPKRCGSCPCARSVDSVDWYCWQCTATEKVLNKFDVQERRPQHCPLVEVKTPHGRLVDIDKVEWFQCSGDVSVGDNGIGKRTFALLNVAHINDLPTVLEAEGEED